MSASRTAAKPAPARSRDTALTLFVWEGKDKRGVTMKGEQVARFADIPNERRVGYAWYGVWPEKLLGQELPRWRKAVASLPGSIAP